jgi:hypothetical protein
MKFAKIIQLFTVMSLCFLHASSQNALINILTHKVGIVKKGEVVFVEVSINNTDPVNFIGIYKIQAKLTVPFEIVSIDTTGHVLPTGWKVTSNDGISITLTNGKDMIAATDSRTLLIAIRGNKIGGPSTIIGQLSFSNGISPGTAPGNLPGDNPGDNSSTSTCKVER